MRGHDLVALEHIGIQQQNHERCDTESICDGCPSQLRTRSFYVAWQARGKPQQVFLLLGYIHITGLKLLKDGTILLV